MDDFDPAELERIRRYGRPDWRRFIRVNWEYGLTPAQIEAQRKEFAKWDRAFETPLARRLRKEQEAREAQERERLEAEIEQDLLAMKDEVASLRLELELADLLWKAECAERKRKADIAWERFMAAWKRGDFRRKANFNPDEPRDERGRWTDEAADGSSETGEGSDTGGQGAGNTEPPPGIGHNNPPDVPQERPDTSAERTSAQKQVSSWLRRGGALGAVFAAASWLRDYEAEIVAAVDPPKTLSELRDAVEDPKPGYQIHHIVEQTSAEQDGFSREQIDSRENVVRIPTLKHRDITSWYQTKNENFEGLSPRDYLRGRSWEERMEVGLLALRREWVLKP